MGPPLYMRSFVDINVVMWRMNVYQHVHVWYLSQICDALPCYWLHCLLTYTIPVAGGSKCPGGGRYSTRIEFLCSRVVGEPVFVEETAGCVQHFSWATPESCPSLVIEWWTYVIHLSWFASVLTDRYEKVFFCANATTCPLWTSWSPLPVVAKV
jgi:hypothetical protein